MDSEKKKGGANRKTTPSPRDTRFTISKFQPEGEFLKHKLTEEDESSEDENTTPVNSGEFNFEGRDIVDFRRYRKLDGQCSIEVVETETKPRKKSIIRQPLDCKSLQASLDIPDHHAASRRGSVHFAETQDVFEIPKDEDSNGNSDEDDVCSADCEADDEEIRAEMNSKLSRTFGTLQRKKMSEPKMTLNNFDENLPEIRVDKTDDETDSSASRPSARYARSTFQDKAPFSVPSLDDESTDGRSDDENDGKSDSESETDNDKVNGLTSSVKRLLRQKKIYGEAVSEPVTPASTPYGTPAPHSFLSQP